MSELNLVPFSPCSTFEYILGVELPKGMDALCSGEQANVKEVKEVRATHCSELLTAINTGSE
jgi:hypothetical protein